MYPHILCALLCAAMADDIKNTDQTNFYDKAQAVAVIIYVPITDKK